MLNFLTRGNNRKCHLIPAFETAMDRNTNTVSNYQRNMKRNSLQR